MSAGSVTGEPDRSGTAGLTQSHKDMRQQLREMTNGLIVERLQTILWVSLVLLPIFALQELRLDPSEILPLYLIKLVQLAATAGVLVALRVSRLRAHAVTIAVFFVGMLCVTAAASNIVRGDVPLTRVLLIVLTMGTATLLPWGFGAQLVTAAIAAVTFLANVLAVPGNVGQGFGYLVIALGAALVGSVYVAYAFERYRLALEERNLALRESEVSQREEAEISAALAQVGREMITLLHTPQLLRRLCQLTTELLQCDYSHTWLWDSTENAFRAVAGFGDLPEQWESIRVVKLPRPNLEPVMRQLERDELFQLDLSEAPPAWAALLAPRHGMTVALLVALRHGDQIFGIHTGGHRGWRELFTARQQRVAKGIAKIASLALDNTRLLEKLERADRVKSEFVATMSHELRTPLNIIMGYNELLLEEACGPLTPQQRDVLQRVATSSSSLLDLINDTLDLSRLEAGRMQLKLSAVDVSELLHDLEIETGSIRRNPGVALMWNAAPGLPQLNTDSLKLKVVLKNLIQNALKFTERGRVTVTAYPHQGGVEFCVTDTGIGIAPEALSIIFEPFRQADGSITRLHGGVGLGLYITRRLLDLLGGTITVDSRLGHGSAFRVWVPGPERQALNQTIGDGLAA